MLSKIKKHWFAVLVGLFIVFYFSFLSLVFFAPREDALSRGFVGCTKKLIDEIYDCQKGSVVCTFKAVIKNNACDFKVVREGFSLWLAKKQKTPWANYFFEPAQEQPQVQDEALEEYYDKHVDIFKEMEDLNKERIELEKSLSRFETEAPEVPNGKQKENEDERK